MFTGDSSGDWLYEALHRYGFANQPHSRTRDDGLKLKDCYVTAAVRCAPPGNKPTAGELANCRRYLEAERELLPNVKIVLVLGRIAHDAWLKAANLARPAFQHGRHYRMPDGSILLCSYHPSRQNTNTGRLTRRMWYAVFEKARKLLANLPEGGSGIDRTGNLLGPGGDPPSDHFPGSVGKVRDPSGQPVGSAHRGSERQSSGRGHRPGRRAPSRLDLQARGSERDRPRIDQLVGRRDLAAGIR
jgi:uracil-DNA glycosylase